MTQTSLTDTQLVILSAAAQRDDFRIEPPERLRGGAAKAVLVTLLAKALIEAEPGLDNDYGTADIEDANRPTYRISRKGLAAIGVEGEASGEPAKPNAGVTETAAEVAAVESGQPTIKVLTSASAAPRAGTKLANVISLLQQPDGASIDDLTAATGWLAHTTRAALTGLRKRGIIIERAKRADGTTIYRIAAAATDETADEVA